MYRFLLSEKGFTAIEILTVVVVLGILTAVGVPVFTSIQKTQEINDCKNQRTVIQALVKEAMYGMVDNGMPQYKRNADGSKAVPEEIVINFNSSVIQSDHKVTYPNTEGDGDNAYEGKVCFHLNNYPSAFTLSDLRGGYRDLNQFKDYEDGCKNGNYLKKKKYDNRYNGGTMYPFYLFLSNEEIPICPRSNGEFTYYIMEDGTVVCSSPDCH